MHQWYQPHCPIPNHITYYISYFILDTRCDTYTFIWMVVYTLIYHKFEIINQSHSCIIICCVSNFSLVNIYTNVYANDDFIIIYWFTVQFTSTASHIPIFSIQPIQAVTIFTSLFSFTVTRGLISPQTSYCQFIESGTLIWDEKKTAKNGVHWIAIIVSTTYLPSIHKYNDS